KKSARTDGRGECGRMGGAYRLGPAGRTSKSCRGTVKESIASAPGFVREWRTMSQPGEPMHTPILYVVTAVMEIAGCFAFWAWLRLGASPLWLIPGVACLITFAWLLTLPDVELAGRTYA